MPIKSAFHRYFAELYEDTMSRIYQDARVRIRISLSSGGDCLDCGAGRGHQFNILKEMIDLPRENYFGIEWDPKSVSLANKRGLQVLQGNLNQDLPFVDQTFQCVFGLSVLEHLINGCKFMQEARRVLKPEGHLILVTPNLSAWFNIFLLALGRMPSSGPHPDSEALLQKNTPIQFQKAKTSSVEDDLPTDRHLVVFMYRTLRYYLKSLGFRKIEGRAYGYYPFPKFFQPFLEKIDPWHCHQMIFDCQR
jgi:SAM-dependent methyltransferase